jgi:hypothetical protein
MSPLSRRHAFGSALRTPAVWRRAARLGLAVGFLQVCLNHGDHWLRHEVTAGVVLKSILSPVLSFAIALLSAASTQAGQLPSASRPPSSA